MQLLNRSLLLAALLAAPAAGALGADEPGVGSTRDQVIARYGQPRAVLSAGSREILTYAAGRVVLEDGRVTRWELPALAPAAPTADPTSSPRVAPAPPAPTPTPVARDAWFTDYPAAQAEATATKRRILALFTGSDWCPGCIAFENQVAHHPDFLATTRASFVLLKLDYPQNHPLPPALKAQNDELRKRYAIHVYPTLLILSPDGATSVAVDTSHPRQADDLADFFVQAVDEARRAKPEDKKWWWPF